MIKYQSYTYFNKTVYQNIIGDSEDLYKTVLDGQWTMDLLHQDCAKSYADLNGNSVYDDDDLYGCDVITAATVDHLTYDAGVRCTSRDENDIPYISINNEHTINVIEKLYSLFYENEGVHVIPGSDKALQQIIPSKFKNEELTFMLGWFWSADYLHDMEKDFGVIPYPLYDENQESYLSLIHDAASIVCLPVTTKEENMEKVGAALELLAYHAWDKITPAYYELALKTKYLRDSEDEKLKILDMIHDSSTTDFGYIYSYSIESMGHITRFLMEKKFRFCFKISGNRKKGFRKSC